MNNHNPLQTKDSSWYFAVIAAIREVSEWLNQRKAKRQKLQAEQSDASLKG